MFQYFYVFLESELCDGPKTGWFDMGGVKGEFKYDA